MEKHQGTKPMHEVYHDLPAAMRVTPVDIIWSRTTWLNPAKSQSHESESVSHSVVSDSLQPQGL